MLLDAPRRHASWAWLALLAAFVLQGAPLAPQAPPSARPGPEPTVADIEAAYLLNFLRYTQWPPERFAGPESPYVLSVVGSPELAARVRAMVATAGRIDGRPVEVRTLASARGSLRAPLDSARDADTLRQLRASHLVFFDQRAGAVHPRVLSDLWRYPVLTVSNQSGFTESGGMLGLFPASGRVVFEANPAAIRNSGLVVSAKVLKLARSRARTPR